MTQKPRKPPRQVRKHSLKQEDKKTVAKYVAKLKQLNSEDGLGSGMPAEAAQTLLRLSKNGVKAIPKKEATALHRKYFVDCWSPIMVALDAHLHMVHEIVDHLKGLGKKDWRALKVVLRRANQKPGGQVGGHGEEP